MGFFASSGILNQRGFFSAPVSAAPPAPSGIPVATTTAILVNGQTFDRYNTFGSYFYGTDDQGTIAVEWNGSSWWWIDRQGEDPFFFLNNSQNQTPDYVPTENWEGGITITAA